MSSFAIIVFTRRVPVQRAVERDEIPYPYKVKACVTVRGRATVATSADVNIATVAMRNSF